MAAVLLLFLLRVLVRRNRVRVRLLLLDHLVDYGPVFSGRVRFLARIPGAKQGPLLFKLKYVVCGLFLRNSCGPSAWLPPLACSNLQLMVIVWVALGPRVRGHRGRGTGTRGGRPPACC